MILRCWLNISNGGVLAPKIKNFTLMNVFGCFSILVMGKGDIAPNLIKLYCAQYVFITRALG